MEWIFPGLSSSLNWVGRSAREVRVRAFALQGITGIIVTVFSSTLLPAVRWGMCRSPISRTNTMTGQWKITPQKAVKPQ
jgi:hypothetical protein